MAARQVPYPSIISLDLAPSWIGSVPSLPMGSCVAQRAMDLPSDLEVMLHMARLYEDKRAWKRIKTQTGES